MTASHPLEPSRESAPDGRGDIFFPVLLLFLFLAITVSEGHLKILWGDEFVTYWVGQRGSFHGIWQALADGADPNPPLMHVLNWWSTTLFGQNALAVRLPSIAAMAMGLVCLWVFLRRRLAPVYAAVGCLALMTMRGFDYAYDARSYSFLMSFAMAALTCWAIAVESEGPRRWLALAGMTLALAAGISSNYYGVLAFFVIAGGEIHRRRIRLDVWIAMAVAALPLLGYLKLIRHNVAEFGPHAWNKPQLSMISDTYLVIPEGIFWPVLGLILFTIWRTLTGRAQKPRPLPHWERAAVVVLMSCPFLAYLIARFGAGMVSPRCAVAVCFGFAIAAAGRLSRVASPRVAGYIVVFLCVWVLAREGACGYVLRQQRHAFLQFRNHVERAAAPEEPVVVGDSLVVMPLYFYGSDALKRQIVFPVDFDQIHRHEADDSGEQNLWGGRHGVFPVPIALPADLYGVGQERVLVGAAKGWVADDLRQRGNSLHEVPAQLPWDQLGGVFTPLAHPETRIFLVEPPAAK